MLAYLVALFLFWFSVVSYALPFNDIVVFGDSLSDNGNLYKKTLHKIPKSPPYYHGHFTNGAVWVEDLAAMYHLQNHLQDYAVGGASAALYLNFKQLPYTIKDEINDYRLRTLFKHHDHTLFIIWAGANDYLNGSKHVSKPVHEAVHAIVDVINRLIALHAKHFLILNLPDIGMTPEATARGMVQNLSDLAKTHNQYLLQAINYLKQQHPNRQIVFFDVANYFKQLAHNPDIYGLQNVTDGCYTGGYTMQQLDMQSDIAIYADPVIQEALRVGAIYDLRTRANLPRVLNCDGYLFWDHIHPTQQIHKLLAQQIYAMLH